MLEWEWEGEGEGGREERESVVKRTVSEPTYGGDGDSKHVLDEFE